MSDASKRRATELKVFENSDPEWDESEFGELSPKVPKPKVTETFVPTLPEGVNTMEVNGRVGPDAICVWEVPERANELWQNL